MIEVCLYEPENPGNVGNIIRTCMCLNASLSIIGYTPVDLRQKTLERAKLDYTTRMSLYPNYEELKKAHQNSKIIYVTRYGMKNYASFDYKTEKDQSVVLMFGRESTGIPKTILRENIEWCARIPMIPNARSLNLADSVSLVLGECQRQRGFEGLSDKETLKGEDYLLKWTPTPGEGF